jgi:hypothetical protein
MQLVNFWLVAVAFLGAAFVQAVVSGFVPLAVGVCAAGAVSSVAFLLLDVRTRALVQVAERALLVTEDELLPAGAAAEYRLVRNADTERAVPLCSYYIVIRGLQATMAVLFAAGGIGSMLM